MEEKARQFKLPKKLAAIAITALVLQLFLPATFVLANETTDTTLDTGDADIQAQIENEVNTTQTELETADADLEQEPSDVEVVNENEAEVSNQVSADANTGENESTEGENVSVVTGNVDIDIIVDNQANTNKVEVDIDSISPCSEIDTECIGDVTVVNQNSATTTTGIEVQANSGQNQAGGVDVAVVTGDVGVEVNISNLINTNITGVGEFIAIDIYGNSQEDIDFSSGQLDDEVLDDQDFVDNILEVENSNDAQVVNDVEVNANSGDNETANGDIETGNVVTEVNISNVVNTNITGSGWIFTVLNIYGDWEGDIVVPSQYSKFRQGLNLVVETDKDGEVIEVKNQNQADVVNNVDVTANTGGNETVNGDVETGDANVDVDVVNQINTNIFDSNWDIIKINIMGSWSGNILGLPDDAKFIQTGDTIIIYRDTSGTTEDEQNNDEQTDQQGNQELSTQDQDDIDVENENEAVVVNNVSITSNTGNNHSSDGSVDTGSADALVNLSNHVNTNITGDNWMYSLINVFGDWSGNLSFGRPDLWVKENITLEKNPAQTGEFIEYYFEFGNNGDGVATGVTLKDFFAYSILNIFESNGGVEGPEYISWEVGELAPGEVGSLSFKVELGGSLNPGYWEIGNNVVIYSNEEDRNTDDNFSSGTFRAFEPASFNTGSSDSIWPTNLAIFKSHNATTSAKIGDIVTYQIMIINTGDLPAYNTLVQDTLVDSLGNEIAVNVWDLGVVYPNEEILIEYDVEILSNAVTGIFVNTAIVEGFDPNFQEWQSDETFKELEVSGLSMTEYLVLQGQQNKPLQEEIILEEIPENSDELKEEIIEQVEEILPDILPVSENQVEVILKEDILRGEDLMTEEEFEEKFGAILGVNNIWSVDFSNPELMSLPNSNSENEGIDFLGLLFSILSLGFYLTFKVSKI